MSADPRSVFRFFAGVLLAGVSTVAVMSQVGQTEAVLLFNARNGTGIAQEIPVGAFQVDGKLLSPGSGKEPSVSVKVSKGYNIRFCAEKTGGGNCEEYGEGTHNLVSAGFNFIKVWKGEPTPSAGPVKTIPPVVVYEERNWGGRSQVFLPGIYRSFRGEFGKIIDNHAMSVVVTKGFRVRFCVDEGLLYRGAGDCEVHEEGRHNLRFADSISFIEVTDLADNSPKDEKLPVVLYEDASQGGKMQGFDTGTFLASQGQFRKLANNQASSIAVKDGYRASVCADEPAAGGDAVNCEEFGPGKKNLKNRKTASYLKVVKESK